MRKFVLVSFLFVGMVCSGSNANNTRYDFNLTEEQQAIAYVDWDVQNITVEIGKKRVELPNISEDMMDYKAFISENLLFEDLNFDGYTDIGVTTGIGYGGVNVIMDYYFYDPQEVRFHKYLKDICNLEIKENSKILASHMKSGMSYFHAYYQLDEKHRPFLFLLGKSVPTDNKSNDLNSEWTAKNVRVKSKRAYFYDNWDGKKLHSYMVKGDKVKVLAMESIDGEYWVRVAYKGKKKPLDTG